nr:MAG TPA: Scaffolding protein SbcC like [Caudoviricetes sp.]
MAIPATYQATMARALPGQVSDTSAYNIDGACVLDGSANVFVGVAVQNGGVDSMGNKLIKPMASGGVAYGVAIRSHFQTTSADGRMVYVPGGGINVMNEGRVWMLAVDGQTQQPYGTAIKVDESTGKVDTTSGTVEPNWIATGDFTEFDGLKLIEVQVKP